MEIYLVVAIVAIVVMAFVGYFIGIRGKKALTETITSLTAERDVQKANSDNYLHQLETQKDGFEKLIVTLKSEAEKTLQGETARSQKQLEEQKADFLQQLSEQKSTYQQQMDDQKASVESQIGSLKKLYEQQIAELKTSFDQQMAQTKEAYKEQIEAQRRLNQEQVKSQLELISKEMQATSENVLKQRQEELGEENKEQVSKIIDPLRRSFKDMQDAFEKTKEQQAESLARLDETIKINMQKSAAIGETADRLTRALTGKVKVQGNFGELKLKQLLEDLELKEGEQFDTQETLKDKVGKGLKGDDGRGLVPDFILHFPNNRHVVVDSKMSLTDFERYMNAEDGTQEKSDYLKAHIDSVRAQVKRLARKEYTKYLPDGYNRLNFAIMYVPIEGALNLALVNDASLWREAYDQGVLILGPQTMYMNLRVLEMMWTQVRQLKNQQAMMDAANTMIDRVQDFGMRFMDVESSVNDTLKKITRLKITTADSGQSIITAARNLLKAGARENKKKKSLADMDEGMFLEAED